MAPEPATPWLATLPGAPSSPATPATNLATHNDVKKALPRLPPPLLSVQDVSDSVEPDRYSECVMKECGIQPALEVKRLILTRADPNRQFKFGMVLDNQAHGASHKRTSVTCHDASGPQTPGSKKTIAMKLYEGTPIAVAALRGEPEMVKALAQSRADLTSTYKFTAGLDKVEMKCPATFAAASRGDHQMLRELFQAKADVSQLAHMAGREQPASLLWSACYHGHGRTVREILRELGPHTAEALALGTQHQDNADLVYTPLHIACRQGHVAVVQELLERRADINRERTRSQNELMNDGDKYPITALTEAINGDREDVVKLLAAKKADVLHPETTKWLFDRKNNMVTIAAAAEGLKKAGSESRENEEYVKRYVSRHLDCPEGIQLLVRFLQTPGDAKMHMVNVMFQHHVIQFETSTDRRIYQHTQIPDNKFNAAVGPHGGYFPVKLKADQTPEVKLRDFIDHLMPGEGDWEAPPSPSDSENVPPAMTMRRKRRCCARRQQTFEAPPMKVPVDVFQCVIKDIYTHPEVLTAMATSDCDNLFKEYSVQAIIKLGWQQIHFRYFVHFWVNLLFASIFVFVARDLNDKEHETVHDLADWAWIRKFMLMIMFLEGVGTEVMQIAGYTYFGKILMYFSSGENYIDWARLCLTGYTISNLVWNEKAFKCDECESSVRLRILFALCVLFRWLKVLNSLRGFEFAGSRVLPVLRSMSVCSPFLFVVLFPTLGFMHAYYVFNIYGQDSLFRSFMIIYRLGFVGDFDFEEMEDIDGWYTRPNMTDPDDNRIEFNDPVATDWHGPTAFVLIAATILVTITMMNIFIAVLCDAYNTAFGLRDQIFWRTRASIVIDETFKMQVEHDFMNAICCRRCASKRASRTPETNEATGEEPHEWKYVWYCRPQQQALSVSDGLVDAEEHSDVKEVDDLRLQMDDLKETLKEMKKAMKATFENMQDLAQRHASLKPTQARKSRRGLRIRSVPAVMRQESVSTQLDTPALDWDLAKRVHQAVKALRSHVVRSTHVSEAEAKDIVGADVAKGGVFYKPSHKQAKVLLFEQHPKDNTLNVAPNASEAGPHFEGFDFEALINQINLAGSPGSPGTHLALINQINMTGMLPPPYQEFGRMASVVVDADGDGKGDFIVTGLDTNEDGIPDVLESLESDWQAPCLASRGEGEFGAATATSHAGTDARAESSIGSATEIEDVAEAQPNAVAQAWGEGGAESQRVRVDSDLTLVTNSCLVDDVSDGGGENY